jgi:hypothetical protein
MTVLLYLIGQEALKVLSLDVPAFAELECRQFPGACHSLDLLAAAVEQFRDVANVQNVFAARAQSVPPSVIMFCDECCPSHPLEYCYH